jgi:hypothetical protein
MPGHSQPHSPTGVYRTARAGLRLTRGQRRRLVGLLVSAGDVWACVLEVNAWRRSRQDAPLVSYQALCRELAASGPGCFGELDSVGARSVLRRYSDAWFAAAGRGRRGAVPAAAPHDDAGPLVSRHLRPGGPAAADPGGPGLPAVTGAPGS